MSAILVALSGLVLGVSLAGPPGPVTAIMVRESSKKAMKGVYVGFGAMSADFVLMMITFFFRSRVNLAAYDPFIFILGAFFFLLIAYFIARSGDIAKEEHRRYNSGYLAGLTIGLVNPMQIGWWLTAGLSFYDQFGLLPFYFLFIGIVFWIFFLSVLVNRFSTKYGEKVNLGVRIFSVVSLTAFGVYFAYTGIIAFGFG